MDLKSLPELDQLWLRRSLRDAKTKVAELKGRLRDEFDQADVDQREPFSITPLTEIRADLVVLVCQSIKDPKPPLAEVIAVQSKSCGGLGTENVLLLSEQLLPLLTAAGVTEE